MVIATENPIEEEGTFNLPEAQMDRFMMKAVMTYPKADEETSMLAMLTRRGTDMFDPKSLPSDTITIQDVEFLRKSARRVHVSEAIMRYAVDLVATSRGAAVTDPARLQAYRHQLPQVVIEQVYANDKPGLGVDIDEREAAKYPCEKTVTTWTQTRLVDGTLQTP